eukprot:SAG25_NODE_5754_length_624_cov_0.792381_1_plen_67_part_10
MDIADNVATTTASTDGSAVTFDKTLPALTSVAVSAAGTAATHAKAGDAVTLTLVADEAVKAPTCVLQ